MKTPFRYLVAFALSAVCGCATVSDLQAKTPEDAIDAFMREYIGVQFGDDISKINGFEDAQYMIPVKKNFLYFDKACCYYKKGKLFRINIWTDIGKEYSQVSSDAQLRKAISDIAEKFGLPKTYFATHMASFSCRNLGMQVVWNKVAECNHDDVKLAYVVKNANVEWPNFRRYVIDIVDTTLDKSLQSNDVRSPNYPPVTDAMRRNWGLPLPDAE